MVLIDEVMNYLHADEADKENVTNLIENAHNYLESRCGPFKIEDYPESKQLVFDFVRFAWNGQSEHYLDSFMTEINNLRWKIINEAPPDSEVIVDA